MPDKEQPRKGPRGDDITPLPQTPHAVASNQLSHGLWNVEWWNGLSEILNKMPVLRYIEINTPEYDKLWEQKDK